MSKFKSAPKALKFGMHLVHRILWPIVKRWAQSDQQFKIYKKFVVFLGHFYENGPKNTKKHMLLLDKLLTNFYKSEKGRLRFVSKLKFLFSFNLIKYHCMFVDSKLTLCWTKTGCDCLQWIQNIITQHNNIIMYTLYLNQSFNSVLT